MLLLVLLGAANAAAGATGGRQRVGHLEAGAVADMAGAAGYGRSVLRLLLVGGAVVARVGVVWVGAVGVVGVVGEAVVGVVARVVVVMVVGVGEGGGGAGGGGGGGGSGGGGRGGSDSRGGGLGSSTRTAVSGGTASGGRGGVASNSSRVSRRLSRLSSFICAVLYAASDRVEGGCYSCVPRAANVEAASLGTYEPSDPALQEDWDERASAGYYLMSQSLELNQRHHVVYLLPEVGCGPKAWTVLKELHAPTSVVATLMLERELSALRLSEGEPVQPVLDKMCDLYAKLATAGITYPEQTKCLKMLSLLPESWLQFTSGLSLPQNQSLWTLGWVRTKILEEDFRRRQLRGGDDGSSGYGMQGSRRGRGRGFGGAGRGAKKDDDSNDQPGGTGWGRGTKSGRGGKSGAGGKMKGSCWYCEKEGHPWILCYKKPDGWTPQNRHQDGGARRNQKNGANMVADSSDNNPKSNGGAEKKKERTAGQFFHIGEQGEQGDASAKVGAELHPLDYWVLDTGAAWTMTPRKELLDDVRAAPINEVCSASGHVLKVAGAGRAAFKGADRKPVVLHDVLLVPDLKANLISLRKLAKAGVSTSTDGARTYKGQLGNRVLWDLHESKDVYRSISMKEIQNVQQQLMKNFKCKTLGEVKYYLGMHVERDLDHRWLKLHQEKFIKELGENYGIENERNVATPLPAEFKLVKAAEDEGVEAEKQQQFQSLVGSLLYAAVYTRPDISFSVGQLASVSVMA
ncbi:unnamed protein product [Closterium sp. NIES-53]